MITSEGIDNFGDHNTLFSTVSVFSDNFKTYFRFLGKFTGNVKMGNLPEISEIIYRNILLTNSILDIYLFSIH